MSDTTLDTDQDTDQQDAVAKLRDPATQIALKEIFKQISEQLDIQEESRGDINDILSAAESSLGVKKKIIRRAARLYHKREAAVFDEENSAVKDLYTIVTS